MAKRKVEEPGRSPPRALPCRARRDRAQADPDIVEHRTLSNVLANALLVYLGMPKELRDHLGKYPPAKPGALGLEPLKAVGRVADAACKRGAA